MAKDCEQVLFVTFAKDGLYQIQCSGLVPGPGHVCCTLIVGENKCLLIDNGFGDDDFTDFPPELQPLMAGKELICVGTHAHPDHIGGARQFPSIWVHPDDNDLIAGIFGDAYDPKANKIGDTQVLPLADGQIFDLGGRKVKTIHTPGHTWGSCCFYDDKSQLIMTGDALNRHVMYQCVHPAVPLRVCAEKLENLLQYNFALFLGGHHGDPFPRDFVTRMVQLIRAFDVEKAPPYIRKDLEKLNIIGDHRNFHWGRGYGDPEYVSIIVDAARLDEYLK